MDAVKSCGIIFLSTPSARRATVDGLNTALENMISIHALREEGDPDLWSLISSIPDFYPRPPRGGRPRGCWTRSAPQLFLSTPSARRATRWR